MRAWRHRWNCRSGGCPRPECDLGTAGRPQLPSRDALAGLSLLLRDELPLLPGTPAVHRMRIGASSTTDQSGAVGRCVLMQPPGQNHRWLSDTVGRIQGRMLDGCRWTGRDVGGTRPVGCSRSVGCAVTSSPGRVWGAGGRAGKRVGSGSDVGRMQVDRSGCRWDVGRR